MFSLLVALSLFFLYTFHGELIRMVPAGVMSSSSSSRRETTAMSNLSSTISAENPSHVFLEEEDKILDASIAATSLPPCSTSKSILKKKKNLVVINAIGRRAYLPYNVHAIQHHFPHDDEWDCIAFMYVNESHIPDSDQHLTLLRDNLGCTVIRTPEMHWGIFLQFLSPTLVVPQYEYIAILLDDVFLPHHGDHAIHVPQLLHQMKVHNVTSLSPGIVGDHHQILNPRDNIQEYQQCLVQVKFLETYFQLFTSQAWKCYYSMLHYTGFRGFGYDVCFRHVCGGRLAVDYRQVAYHLDLAWDQIPPALIQDLPLLEGPAPRIKAGMYKKPGRDIRRYVRDQLDCPSGWTTHPERVEGLIHCGDGPSYALENQDSHI